jgi:hypothetical protein
MRPGVCVHLTRVNMKIVNLPEEVLVLILEYLNTRDQLNLQAAHESFHRILENNKLIRQVFFNAADERHTTSFRDYKGLFERPFAYFCFKCLYKNIKKICIE